MQPNEEEPLLVFPIVDTHVHLIYPSVLQYNWQKEFPELLNERSQTTYLKEYPTLNVKAMIFMEVDARNPQEELAHLQVLAKSPGSLIKGIVCHIDLSGSIDKVKDFLNKVPLEKVVGFRYLLQDLNEKNTIAYLQDEFLQKVCLCTQENRSFHLTIHQNQMRNVIEFMKRIPKTCKIVLDHLGKPFFDTEKSFEEWKENMLLLKNYENLYFKISPGFCFPTNYFGVCQKYLEFIVDNFLDERVFVGSDYGFAASYVAFDKWIELFLQILKRKNVADDKILNIFYKNAEAFYQLYNKI